MVECAVCHKSIKISGSYIGPENRCYNCSNPVCGECGAFCGKCVEEMREIVEEAGKAGGVVGREFMKKLGERREQEERARELA